MSKKHKQRYTTYLFFSTLLFHSGIHTLSGMHYKIQQFIQINILQIYKLQITNYDPGQVKNTDLGR